MKAGLVALGGAAWLAVSATAAAAQSGNRVVVAWDTGQGQAFVAALDAAPPYAFVTPALALGRDGLVRVAGGSLFHLSRSGGVLTRIDPQGWTATRSYALGAAGEPRDVAVVGAKTAYVSRRNARYLQRLDLDSGAEVDAIDLAPLGAGDGNPALDTMLVHEGRLYLQLAGEPGFPPQPHAIAVIDLAKETLVDADPAAPGIQGIALVGTGPRFKMQIVPGTHQLLVSATGAFHDDGGLERVDLDTLNSQGLVVFEQIEAGADLGAFTLQSSQRGWLVFSTDLLLSSHLHPFTLEGGMENFEADVSLDYFVPQLVYDASSDTLFWPEPDGVKPFDATTGEALASPTPLAGLPTDLALLEAAPVAFAAPAWAYAALVLALGATGFALLARQRA